MDPQIKVQYNKLRDKKEFGKIAAKKFGRSSNTIMIHWIGNENIPLEFQKDFLALLKKTVRIQKNYERKLRNLQ